MMHLRDALSDLHKVANEDACEVALKGALKVGLKLHLWFIC